MDPLLVIAEGCADNLIAQHRALVMAVIAFLDADQAGMTFERYVTKQSLKEQAARSLAALGG